LKCSIGKHGALTESVPELKHHVLSYVQACIYGQWQNRVIDVEWVVQVGIVPYSVDIDRPKKAFLIGGVIEASIAHCCDFIFVTTTNKRLGCD